MCKKIIIAIDGYSSCGKSTFARAIAQKLGYTFIDTGAMYRAVTLYGIEHGMERIHDVTLDYVLQNWTSERIRTIEVSNLVSGVSSIPEVREKLVALQREMGRRGGVVMDGRDIGTVVFPHAELKIFMTARVEVRVARRYDELTAKGIVVTRDEVRENLISRDLADTTRTVSPLRQAEDAIVLDNSDMTVEEQMTWFTEQFNRVCGSR